MPSRWFVPVLAVDPSRVQPEFVHAAFTAWFDRSSEEHTSQDKPYAISALVRRPSGHVGVEVATLTAQADALFRTATASAPTIRLGSQVREIGQPRLMHQHAWTALAEPSGATTWNVELVTPATFRTGDRSSPLPSLTTILGALGRAWDTWSGLPRREVEMSSVWVSALDLRSTAMKFVIRQRAVEVTGVHGTMTIRCDDTGSAPGVGSLLQLASYAGIGGLTQRGLGLTRVESCTAGRLRGSARPHRPRSVDAVNPRGTALTRPGGADDGLAS